MKAPHEEGIWTFEDLSAQRPVKAELTAREREVAARLLDGMTSKEIGKALVISHRTVEIYRARLMRKYKASTTADLVHKLMAGVDETVMPDLIRHPCWRAEVDPGSSPAMTVISCQ